MVRFHFARPLTKTKLHQEYHQQSCWFGLFTRQSRNVQLHSRTLGHYRAIKSRDKIAGVTSVLALHVAEAYVTHYRPTTKIKVKVKVKCARLHEECRRVSGELVRG